MTKNKIMKKSAEKHLKLKIEIKKKRKIKLDDRTSKKRDVENN